MAVVYSDVFGFVPCGLCWLQRVFLFPQVILLTLALVFRDQTFYRYGIALSIPGLIIGLYQHYLQMGGPDLVGCPVAGDGADCSARFLFEFGFMTFPLLSAAAFAFLIAVYTYLGREARRNSTG
jgi:disulfide bond formation protein DsbB